MSNKQIIGMENSKWQNYLKKYLLLKIYPIFKSKIFSEIMNVLQERIIYDVYIYIIHNIFIIQHTN